MADKKKKDEETEEKSEAKKKPSRSRSNSRKKKDADDKAEAKADDKKAKSKKADSSKKDDKSKKADKSKKDDKKAKKDEKKAKKDEPEEKKPQSAKEVQTESVAFLTGLFEKMGYSIKAEPSIDGKSVSINLTGDDAEGLLGAGNGSPRSLDAIQTLARAAVSDGTGFQLNLDIGGFREKRTQRLQDVATKLADAAEKVGQPVVIAGFNSFERRVIHKALDDRKSVNTDSEGYGAFRKLRVDPN